VGEVGEGLKGRRVAEVRVTANAVGGEASTVTAAASGGRAEAEWMRVGTRSSREALV
jgi:hypothetical protein